MTQEEFFFLIGVLCSFVRSVTFYISVFFSLFLFFYCCSQASLQKKKEETLNAAPSKLFIWLFTCLTFLRCRNARNLNW